MNTKLVSDLALSGTIGRQLSSLVLELSPASTARIWFDLWREQVSNQISVQEADAVLFRTLGMGSQVHGEALFAAQTYAALVVHAFNAELDIVVDQDRSFFRWALVAAPEKAQEITNRLRSAICAELKGDVITAKSYSSLLGAIFQSIFPAPLRHLLGEYYTPAWVVERSVEMLDIDNLPEQVTVFDPAGGSGGYVVQLIALLVARRTFTEITAVVADVNPIALEFARSNLAFLANELTVPLKWSARLGDTIVDDIQDDGSPLFPERLIKTTILGEEIGPGDNRRILRLVGNVKPTSVEEPLAALLTGVLEDRFFFLNSVNAHIICGNPPWITWDGLLPEYRRRVATQWSTSTLQTNSGWKSRVAAGKQDVSALFVYRAADRHAALRAQMVFALPLSLFQSRQAGAGFRRFTSESGRCYGLRSIEDMSRLTVFEDALNRTALASFSVDVPTSFPIAYTYLHSLDTDAGSESYPAVPMDPSDPLSPIVPFKPEDELLKSSIGKSDYRARGGVNTGGANGILWVETTDRNGNLLKVRNTGKTKGGTLPVHEGWVEAEATVPLLLGRDIKRWSATPSRQMLLLYELENSKQAMPETLAQRRMPRAVEYLQQFRDLLLARKEYHRWGGTGPFYEVYRIGPYTFSETKVVWQHTGFKDRLNPAVITDNRRSITIPDQKVIILAIDDVVEAHYVCAYLSSSIIAEILRKYIGLDASTHILDYVALKKFDRDNPLHIRLSQLSMDAHDLAGQALSPANVEQEIDGIVLKLLSHRQVA